jgi:hypothetical protein
MKARIREVNSNNAPGLAWLVLRRLHNRERVKIDLIEAHSIEERFWHFADKQALQIGRCVSQAEEYYVAAKSASLATRPLQLYYCAMSLALAEILRNGDGGVSLDNIRKSSRGHGLEFKISQDKLSIPGLANVFAVPTVRGSKTYGTFSLWHEHTKSESVVGLQKQAFEATTFSSTSSEFLLQGGQRRNQIQGRLNLLGIVERVPHLFSHLEEFGLASKLLRSTFSSRIKKQNGQEFNDCHWIVHSSEPDTLYRGLDQMMVHPSEVQNISTQEIASGISIMTRTYYDQPTYRISYPEAISITSELTYVISELTSLNEFGDLYLASYLLGMLCRYYPDLWMNELERQTEFAAITELVLAAIEQRLPIAAAKNLTDTYLLYTDIGMNL